MNKLLTALFLILACIPLPETTGLVAGAERTPQLQFTTSIVKERSCAPDHLSLELKFTFRNVGSEPVILDKQSFVGRTLVSQSLKRAAAKRYEQESRADLVGDIFPVSPEDLSTFAVIQPGATYDLQTEQTRVSIDINDGTPHSRDDLRPGSYFLQVQIATWTYMSNAEHFEKKWKTTGLLWWKGLTSYPMPFVIDPGRPISKCR